MIKISIIIPVYNAGFYLERCILSVINQSYDSYELIIVDDGSEDDSLRICEKYADGWENFHVFSQENQGVSAARNKAVSMAQGEWIYFLDSDDELEAQALQNMDAAISESCDWVVMNFRKHVEGTDVYTCNVSADFAQELQTKKEGIAELLNSGLFMYSCGKMYRNDIIKQNRLEFPVGVPYGEDIRFNLQYFQYVNQYVVRDISVFIYHIRQGEGAGSRYYENAFEQQMDIDKEILFMVEKCCCLSLGAKAKLNSYFFQQGIGTASAYLTIWRELPFTFRYREIKKIMRDRRFLEFLEKEKSYGSLNRMDYFLLKKSWFITYYVVHYLYTKWKIIRKKKEKH